METATPGSDVTKVEILNRYTKQREGVNGRLRGDFELEKMSSNGKRKDKTYRKPTVEGHNLAKVMVTMESDNSRVKNARSRGIGQRRWPIP